MFKAEQEIMSEIDPTHWGFAGGHFIFERIFKKLEKCFKERRFLDVGCGVGNFLPYLNLHGRTFGIDYSYDALKICQKRGILKILQADSTKLPFHDNLFDMVTLLDVAEHVDNDLLLLQEAYRVTKKGGYAYLRVPAHKALWGPHDITFCHKRRYSKKHLLRIIFLSGFKLKRFTYLHPHLLPFMFLLRYINRKRKNPGKSHDFTLPPGPINKFLFWLMKCEGLALGVINFPIGISICCILQKENS